MTTNMTPLPFSIILSLLVAFIMPQELLAGTLNDAPFRIIIPTTGWRLDDSKAQSIGGGAFLVATVSNTNTLLKSIVAKRVFKKVSESTLNEMCAGINDTFATPGVKKISEANTIFLGYKARKFAFEVTQAGQTTYNESIIFIADDHIWIVGCVGQPDQKDEFIKIISFYQKK